MRNIWTISTSIMCLSVGLLPGVALADAATDATSDWPSYNRTLNSDRFSPLAQITKDNVASLKVACTFDTGETTQFQSGLVQVDGALFATTQNGTYSINPDTCQLNWKAVENMPPAGLDAQRGVAVADGRVFRGGRNAHVYAYDEKTGAKLWETEIGNMAAGEAAPASPIAWGGLVFIGNSGGDMRGVKGRMYALDAATGKIVWEFYMVPRQAGDIQRGPEGAGGPPKGTWDNAKGINITGGGNWTSYTLDTTTGELYVPGGNPAPDFAESLRKGSNLFAGSVVVLDAKTGALKRFMSLVPDDFHDYDVASTPSIFTTRGGRELMAVTPKDGFLYTYDRKTNKRLYRKPMSKIFNTQAPLTTKGTRFCPGVMGGSEWNGTAYDRVNDAILSGQVELCDTVTMASDASIKSVSRTQAWSGGSNGFGKSDPKDLWAGWVNSVNPVTGAFRWRFKAPLPVVSGVTPTAGGIVLFGDVGGTFYALDSKTGRKLADWNMGGAVGGGVITYDTGAGQKVAVAAGMTSPSWDTSKTTAKIVVMAP